MAAANTSEGIFAAFGDSREEALEKLGDLLPDDAEMESLFVGDEVDARRYVRDVAADLDEGEL